VRYLVYALLTILPAGPGATAENLPKTSSVVSASPAVTQTPTGRVLQYGVYTLLRGGEVVEGHATTTGKAVSRPVITRDRETDRIPLIPGKYMAYQYRLSGLPEPRRVKLRRVLVHPPMTLPDGSVTTGSDYMINRKVERHEVFAFDAYAFNEDYELVEGEWIFQIWYGDEKLVEQRFTTFRPETDAQDG
jgi:hypothetical protein